MPTDIAALRPGQNIKCTLTAAPRSHGATATVQRLMQMSPETKKGLRKAQHLRRQNMVVYNRGNRDWTKRARCGTQVRVEAGSTWTMPFTAQIAPDLRSVASVVSIEPA
ncbi:MAG: hypothetical protein IT437_11770 [Phycisphaerales bacterium]|nr:hypothetical protein [Phycisphaerales bacterium]